MGLLDFFSSEAGQGRRKWLDRQNDELLEAIQYFAGPGVDVKQATGLLNMFNPVNDMGEAMADTRDGDYIGAAINTASALAPAAAWKLAGSPADDIAGAVTDTLAGFNVKAQGAMDAGRQFAGDESGALSWGDRIEQSTPSAWIDPKYEKPQWHPASKTSMSVPAGEIDPIWADTVRLTDEVPLSIEDWQGRLITPAYGDRTRAGGELRGYNDTVFDDPVRMLGGRDFMREPETGLWASEKGPMSAKGKAVTRQIEAGENPALVYTAMNSQSGDFSTLMMDAVMNQYNPKVISDDAAKVFDDRMAKLGVDAWPGSKSSKEKINEALKNMPGSSRWQVWQEMDKAAYKSGGFPDIGQTRVAITDPELLDVTPFASGLSVGRPRADVSDDKFVPHPSYSHQIDGDYEGTLGNLPGQLVWRDFFEARRGAGASSASDQRAFMMSSPSIMQRVDQQMIDEISQFIFSQDRLK